MQINYPSGPDTHRLGNLFSRPPLYVVLNLIFNCFETDRKVLYNLCLYPETQDVWPDPTEKCSYFSDAMAPEGWKTLLVQGMSSGML